MCLFNVITKRRSDREYIKSIEVEEELEKLLEGGLGGSTGLR